MNGWLGDTFGTSAPIVCAPMAGPGSGRLAAAVSAAGALGMVGVGSAATPDWVAEQCAVAASSGRPFGVGLMAWALAGDRGQLDAVLAADPRPSLVSVSFGPFADLVAPLRKAGVRVATQVGNLDDALAADRAGVDVIVARGAEAGGHGRADMGTLPLLQLVLDAVQTPVLAAGGVSTARGVAAVLAGGAAGAWVGTAFLGCIEAEMSEQARARLFAAGAGDTAYGRVFDVAMRLGWPPEFGGRALRNAFFDRWQGREDELAEDDTVAAELEAARREQDFDVAPIYAGQGVGLLRARRSAADVVASLTP